MSSTARSAHDKFTSAGCVWNRNAGDRHGADGDATRAGGQWKENFRWRAGAKFDRERDGFDRERDGFDRERDGFDRERDGFDRERDGCKFQFEPHVRSGGDDWTDCAQWTGRSSVAARHSSHAAVT
jgi:hypothetical protein